MRLREFSLAWASGGTAEIIQPRFKLMVLPVLAANQSQGCKSDEIFIKGVYDDVVRTLDLI
jgi:hypothetical protein